MLQLLDSRSIGQGHGSYVRVASLLILHSRELTLRTDGVCGLSPHTRGKRYSVTYEGEYSRPIPAHAGETARPEVATLSLWAYPCTRGGNPGTGKTVRTDEGLSPHTRGKRALERELESWVGPIPAHAGETSSPRIRQSGFTAYPRARGGNSKEPCTASSIFGLSPHTRGKQLPACPNRIYHRPIPAHAGETGESRSKARVVQAYPRTRGGNAAVIISRSSSVGLSPHTRGKLP